MVKNEVLQDPKVITLRLNLVLAMLEGLFVFWIFLREPSESQSAVLLGFSPLRLVLLLVILALYFVMFSLFVSTFRRVGQDRGAGKLLRNAMDQTTTFWALLLWIGLMYVSLFLSERQLGFLAPYRERLSPLLIWLTVLSIQMIVSFVYLRGIGLKLLQHYRDVLAPAFVALTLLALFIVFISLSQVGLTPDANYWQGPGVPLLFYQVIIGVAAGLLFGFLIKNFNPIKRFKVDIISCIGIWVLASIIWLSQSAMISYNSLEPGPPNFQSYPFGDALHYDTTAHNFLAGIPMPSDFWAKPFYSFFLAFLHILVGEDYKQLIILQVLFLAVIPVLVFLLVSLIGNRPAGMVACLLVILREKNGMALSNILQVSHLKILLSDIFSMGLMAFLLWLIFLWLEKPNKRQELLFALGGVFSLLVLTRGHPVILLPVCIGVIFIAKYTRPVQWWRSLILFTLGIVITLSPWFWRIYQTTGRLSFQDPASPYIAQMAGAYDLTPNLSLFFELITSPTIETDIVYYDEIRNQIVRFILRHPNEVLRFVSAHFFHNVIHSYIYLPQSFRIESLRAYITIEPFWNSWNGALSFHGWVLLSINILMIALGVGTAWKKHKFLALVPVIIGAGYNLSISIGRISGWRFILPADWITMVYYSLGLVQLSNFLGYLLTRKTQCYSTIEETPELDEKISSTKPRITGYAMSFLLIGLAITYGNKLFDGRSPEIPANQLMAQYLEAMSSVSNPLTKDNLSTFLQDDRAIIAHGQAIYPYFLKLNSGPINHFWPAYKPRPYDRLVFYLVGPYASSIVIPMPTHEFTLPDGANVIVIGCLSDTGDIEAISVLVKGELPILIVREPPSDLVCPLQAPT